MKQKFIKYILLIAFIIGLTLFSIDLLRFVFPLRSEELYKQPLVFPDKILLTPEEAFAKIDADKNLPDKEYAIEINGIVHNSIIHYWEDDKKYEYRIQIPIFRNYILFFLSRVIPVAFDKFEFCDYQRAITRGVGLCSQLSLAMKDILNKRNIEAEAMELDGHVVVTALVDKNKNEWWIFDPDYGVIIDHSLEEIENNPEIIRPYYKEKGYDDKTIDNMVSIYGKKVNEIYGEKTCGIENASYVLIWLIPIILTLPYTVIKIIDIVKPKKNEKENSTLDHGA